MADVILTNGSFVGEGAALLAAFLWAAATLMFGKLGQQLSPLLLNIVKGGCAIAMMMITLVVQAQISPDLAMLPALPTASVIFLLLSGALGIGLGDTAYFSAINTLGARRALLLETLAPPISALLAWLFLSEQLSLGAVTGIAVTLLGVAWVVSERTPGTELQTTGSGLRVALLATFCQAAGAVLSRAALADTVVSPLWSSLIRLLAGLVFMVALALARSEYLVGAVKPTAISTATAADTTAKKRGWRNAVEMMMSPRLLGAIALTSFFATYLGIWLQQVALKYTATGIAQALLATSPLFVLPMAALLGERLSWRTVGGVVIALAGVCLLLSSS
ncbi:MAG: DMT family transporter [Phormidesmis sp.]